MKEIGTEMKKVALDTNIAADILNGKTDTIQFVRTFDLIFLPVTVEGELLFGAKNSGKREENLKRFRAFIGSCEILDINHLVAEEYASIRYELKTKGKPIPENDIWIAAICIVNRVPLFTRDTHFQYIDDITLVSN